MTRPADHRSGPYWPSKARKEYRRKRDRIALRRGRIRYRPGTGDGAKIAARIIAERGGSVAHNAHRYVERVKFGSRGDLWWVHYKDGSEVRVALSRDTWTCGACGRMTEPLCEHTRAVTKARIERQRKYDRNHQSRQTAA